MRVAQEALTNCRKYAQARQVTLTLSYMNNLVTLNVQDDGVGFDPAEPPPDSSDQSTGGFGIMGMRERAHSVGGELCAGPRPEGGFEVTTALPLQPYGAGERTSP